MEARRPPWTAREDRRSGARVLITGSTAGIGLGAARELLAQGHEVVFHARHDESADGLGDRARRATGIVTGDLASRDETAAVAEQVNDIGGIDAVIHNAGIYVDHTRVATAEGHPRPLAVNVLAPYLLTAWIDPPARLIYLSSDMHR